MRPEEVVSMVVSSSLECEITPLEFVQDLVVLLVDGRLPDGSEHGRKEGTHCWPLSLDSRKTCCTEAKKMDSQSLCNLVSEVRSTTAHILKDHESVVVEVFCSMDSKQTDFHHVNVGGERNRIQLNYLDSASKYVLIEKWKVELLQQSQVIGKPKGISMQLLLQAVRSFLHFSQLSAWLISTQGRSPFFISYKICSCCELASMPFVKPEEIHEFPITEISKNSVAKVTSFSLPRVSYTSILADEIRTTIAQSTVKLKHCKQQSCHTVAARNDHLNGEPGRSGVEPCHNGSSSKVYSHDACLHPICLGCRSRDCSCNSGRESYGSCKQCRESYCNGFTPSSESSLHEELRGAKRKIFKESTSDSRSRYANSSLFRPSGENRHLTEMYCKTCGDHCTSTEFFNDKPRFSDRKLPCSCNRDPFVPRSLSESVAYAAASDGKIEYQQTSSPKALDMEETLKGLKIEDSCDFATYELRNPDYPDFKWSKAEEEMLRNLCSPQMDYDQFCKSLQQRDADLFGSCETKARYHCAKSLEKQKENLYPSHTAYFQGEVDDDDKGITFTPKCTRKQSTPNKDDVINSEPPQNGEAIVIQDALDKEVTPTPNVQTVIRQLHARSKSASASVLRERGSQAVLRERPRSSFPRLSLGACTVPVFDKKTNLPINSSPAPLRRPESQVWGISGHRDLETDSELSDDYSSPHLLSKSAPASTSLLGNFEESMLKGRMPPVGRVEGFSIVLGASGSFCPRQISFPVRAHFFNLSDDDAPSPYLGYVRLKDSVVGRKGYHIPKNGTVQVSLFNPHKTVVKVFVVLYNYQDMPCNSQTFLRQRIVSAKPDGSDDEGKNQSLHYLIHLRFRCSKHGRLYLHTDIRVIFPQQTPDLEPGSRLFTLTDAPSDPKYTPMKR